MENRKTIYLDDAIDVVSKACQEFRGIFGRCKDGLLALPPAPTVLPRWIVYHIDPHHPKNFSDLMMPGDYYICPICGHSNSIATNYCPYCGKKLGEAEENE